MKAYKLSLPRRYLLHGCLYKILNLHQIVQVKALHPIQLVDCVWSTRCWHLCPKTGILNQDTLCSRIGEERLCASPGCVWLLLWWIILSLINSRDPMGKYRL